MQRLLPADFFGQAWGKQSGQTQRTGRATVTLPLIMMRTESGYLRSFPLRPLGVICVQNIICLFTPASIHTCMYT